PRSLTIPDPAAPSTEPRLVDLLVAALLYTGLLFMLSTVVDARVLARGESEAAVFLALQAVDDGILAAVALGFGRLRFPGSWRALGFCGVRPSWWAIGTVGGALAAALAWGVGVGLDRWGWPAPPHPVESVLAVAEGPRDVLLILLAVTVPVPVAEEVFFRGFAYRLLRAKLGVG